MAKKRKRTYTRRRASPKRTYRRRSSSTKTAPLMYGLYGAARGYVNQYARMIPVIGGFGDEAAMLAVTYAGKRWGGGTIKKVATAGFNVECFNLGRALTEGGLGGLFSGGSSASGLNVYG